MFASWRKYFTMKKQSLSLLRIFKPMYILLTILGLFPYCVKFKTNHCVIIPRTIYLNLLCAVSVILTISGFVCFLIRDTVHEINTLTDAVMTHINLILEVLLLEASCITAYISIYRYRYKIVNILNSLTSAWISLPSTRDDILENLRYQVQVSLYLLLFLLISQTIVNVTRNNSFWKIAENSMAFIFPHMIQLVSVTFYNVLVIMLVAVVNNIEKVLKTLEDTERGMKGVAKVASIPTILNLKAVELVFVKAFVIKREINEAFQASILLTSVQCFHAIVSEAHIIYHGIFVSRELTTHNIINFSLWIVYQLLKIYILSNSGNLLKKSTHKIGRALYNIPTEKHDMRTLIEIQHFNSLMSYQDTDFTVYGFFLLDASLMFKVVASAAMYLVILVQFDNKN